MFKMFVMMFFESLWFYMFEKSFEDDMELVVSK